jgi:hypothetical protein
VVDELKLLEVEGGRDDEFDLLEVRVRRGRPNRRATLEKSVAINALANNAGLDNSNGANTPLPPKNLITKEHCPTTVQEKLQQTQEAKQHRTLPFLCRIDLGFDVPKLRDRQPLGQGASRPQDHHTRRMNTKAADLFTKALSFPAFHALITQLMAAEQHPLRF